jgi:hypothetical protein
VEGNLKQNADPLADEFAALIERLGREVGENALGPTMKPLGQRLEKLAERMEVHLQGIGNNAARISEAADALSNDGAAFRNSVGPSLRPAIDAVGSRVGQLSEGVVALQTELNGLRSEIGQMRSEGLTLSVAQKRSIEVIESRLGVLGAQVAESHNMIGSIRLINVWTIVVLLGLLFWLVATRVAAA